MFFFFFSSRRRHTRLTCDWSSDVCSSDLFSTALSFHSLWERRREMKAWKTLLAVAALSCANHALALGGLADLSVYDRTEARQLQVYWHEGRAYVVGKPGNEYQVTLRGKLREEVLAVVPVYYDSYRNLLAHGVI